MMNNALHELRARFHPLYHLRRHFLSRRLLKAVGIPVWARLPECELEGESTINTSCECVHVIQRGGARGPGNFPIDPGTNWNLVILDVGANMDYYSWLIKSIQPKAKVRMFEPETDNVCH